ncbi:MAG: membrane protein insertion efficiency factor YidD [Verrucomicrobiota bacterium]
MKIFRACCLFLVAVYRKVISPILHLVAGPSYGCRFVPTCSQYAEQALKIHPPLRALGLIVRRVSRCHPWGGSGYDPVPEANDARFKKKDRPPRSDV